jgi:hypothetical protein
VAAGGAARQWAGAEGRCCRREGRGGGDRGGGDGSSGHELEGGAAVHTLARPFYFCLGHESGLV